MLLGWAIARCKFKTEKIRRPGHRNASMTEHEGKSFSGANVRTGNLDIKIPAELL
jgi:hypothetical protein